MKDFLTLFTCKLEQAYKIKAINNLDYKSSLRLYELGFFAGEKVKVLRKSVLKKTLLIEIGGYTLCMRSDIAKCVVVL